MTTTKFQHAGLDLERLVKTFPKDLLRKVSLNDIHQIAKNYNEDQAPNAKVFSRPECVFVYCPHQESCQDGCQNLAILKHEQ